MALAKDNKVYLETIKLWEGYSGSINNFDYFTRPPIKFIASLIKAVNQKTKFGTGYFTEGQLEGKAVGTKEEKLDFLKMLHIYTEYVNKAHIKVDPAKIAAGQDVENTLMLLQAVIKGSENPKMEFETAAKRAMKKFESEKNASNKDGDAPKSPEKKKSEDKSKEEAPKSPEKKKERPKEEKPKEEKPKEEAKQEEKKEERKRERKKEEPKPEEKKEEPKPEEKPKEEERPRKKREEPKPEEKKEEERPRKKEKPPKQEEPVVPSINVDIEDDANPAARPMTARKAPPKVKDEAPVITESKVTTIIKEEDVDDDVDDVFVEESAAGQPTTSGQENGQLVQKILEEFQNVSTKQGGSAAEAYDADRFKQSIEFAKGLLQHLARSAQPLDTLIQFSQEDLGNMENEYTRWTEECKKQEKLLEQERAQTETALHDLNSKVEDLDKDIARQESRLRLVKAAALLKESELMKDFAGLCQQ